jgi:ABC-type glutathione transport system ATPase component
VIREICQRVYVLNEGILVETAEGLFPAIAVTAAKGPRSPAFLPDPRTSASSTSSSSFFEVRSLRKCFRRNGKSFLALDGVSLRLREGETYALVGESGSGKSTLALSMLALQGVDGGAVLYKGEDLLQAGAVRMRALRREIRLLFQHPEAVLNGGMTVFAILAEGLEKDRKVNRAEIRGRVLKALEQVHLSGEYARRYPHHLSSGEKQRVAIARALITEPKLLVCDEPVASLDHAIQKRILELLRELQEKMGLTYFFISHNLEWVNQMAQRVGVMYQGKIVEELSVEDFNLEKAQHPYTRLLLASSPGS